MTLSKFISFFTTVAEYTGPPKTEEDWQVCYDTYGAEVPEFEGMNLSMEQFKRIDKAMGSRTTITVSRTTPLAVFFNIQKFFMKQKLPDTDGK